MVSLTHLLHMAYTWQTPFPHSLNFSILAQGSSPVQAHHTLFSCCKLQAKQHVNSTWHLTSAKKNKKPQNRSRDYQPAWEIYKTSLPYCCALS